jgi:uncharacterized protein
MKKFTSSMLLKIYFKESDKYLIESLQDALAQELINLNLSGFTIYKGVMGLGADKKLHSAKILRIGQDLPLVIEVIDSKEKINSVLPILIEIIEKANSNVLLTTQEIKSRLIHKK